MVQIAMLLLAFPLGLLRWSRRTAYAVVTAVFIVVLIPQTIAIRNTKDYNFAYWIVQVITLVVALALVTWASKVSTRRRARRVAA